MPAVCCCSDCSRGKQRVVCTVYPWAKPEEVKNLIKDMWEQGVIEPPKCQWTFPIVLVQEKGQPTRFCSDYGKLNDVTQKDSTPRIDGTLDSLVGAVFRP